MKSTESTTLQRVSEESEPLAFREKLSYGLGNFGEQMIFNPATVFIVFFYTDVAGIAAATVGALLLVSRVFDLFNPVMGLIVDRTQTRHGKGRPWILWLSIPFGLAAALLFTVPSVGPSGKIIYAFITYNLALILMTAVDVPYTAMLSHITPNQHQRTLLSLFRMMMNMAGGILSFAITLPMVKLFGGGAPGWQRSFILFGVIGTVSLLLCFAGTRERSAPALHGGQASVPVMKSLAALLGNQYWLALALLLSVLFVLLGFLGSNVYYCQYVLHKVALFGPLMTVLQLSMLIGMFGCGPLFKRFGKRNLALLGLGVAIFGQAIMFMAPTHFGVVLAGMIVRGLGSAPLLGSLFAMVADTIDFGEFKFGFRADGLAFGTIALLTRVFIGLGGAAVGFILSRSGYVAGAEIQSPMALKAINAMFLHIPLAMLVAMALVLWTYGLDKRYPVISAELSARRSGSN